MIKVLDILRNISFLVSGRREVLKVGVLTFCLQTLPPVSYRAGASKYKEEERTEPPLENAGGEDASSTHIG